MCRWWVPRGTEFCKSRCRGRGPCTYDRVLKVKTKLQLEQPRECNILRSRSRADKRISEEIHTYVWATLDELYPPLPPRPHQPLLQTTQCTSPSNRTQPLLPYVWIISTLTHITPVIKRRFRICRCAVAVPRELQICCAGCGVHL